MTDRAVLAATANRLRNVPGFIAFELDRYYRITQCDPAGDFDLPAESLAPMGLCRRPRRDHFATDVVAIADRVGVGVGSLANFVRTSDAVTALAARREAVTETAPGTRGMLAAARDHVPEQTEFEEPTPAAPTLPGWLGQAADRFWGGQDEPSTFPRDLHLPILMNLPLAIIEIDALTVGSLDEWLRSHHLPELAAVTDRPLRGCLVAYAGIGVLFVNRSDNPEQRRLTLAHEAAHFIVDYLLPRDDVRRRRPELIDVLDGERTPTDAERFDALLADVPVGFHAHLLERDVHGGHLTSVTTGVEDRAERLALELLAPLLSVLRDVAVSEDHDPKSALRERFGLPAGVALRYGNYIQHYRPSRPSTLLDAIGLAGADDEIQRSEPAAEPDAES